MKRMSLFVLFVALAIAFGKNERVFRYPDARKSDQIDDYHGTKVADPYRWLEDPDSPETRAWIDAENRLTESYLAQIPERAALRQRLTALWNYPKYGAPFHKVGRYFFFKNDGLQNQSVLYKQASLTAGPETLLDPNLLSEDGTVAISTLAVSEDSKLLAYGTSASGSDWEEFRVRDVASGRDLPDHLQWIKFSGASWTKDGAGFFYSRYPQPGDKALTDVNRFQRLYYHRLGSDPAEDVLVYERPDQPDWGMNAEVTDDGRYAILSVWLGTDRRNRVYYLDLRDGAAGFCSGGPRAGKGQADCDCGEHGAGRQGQGVARRAHLGGRRENCRGRNRGSCESGASGLRLARADGAAGMD